MKIKKTICLLLITLVTGCSASLSLSGDSHTNGPISIGDTTTTTKTTKITAKTNKTTKEKQHSLDNTIWEYVGTNNNYKYLYFKDDNTNVDEFAVYSYDTSSRYIASACHFLGFGDIISNDADKVVIELDNGKDYTLNFKTNTTFIFEDITYTRVNNNKLTLTSCN